MITKMIGIDPDSKGFQCILVDTETDKPISRNYLYTENASYGAFDCSHKP